MEGVQPVLPVEIRREAVESYAPSLQASGEMHDPVFGVPTQYGTPYHALYNAMLPKVDGGKRKPVYADRAVRGLEAALDLVIDPGLPPTASGFDGATGAVSRSNHSAKMGWVDFGLVFEALEHVGYDGWLVMEDFSGVRPSREALRYNLEFAQTFV